MSGGLQGFFGQINHLFRSPEMLKLAMSVAGIFDAWRTGLFHISKDSFTQWSFLFLLFDTASYHESSPR